MLQIDTNELTEKARLLAHSLGKNTSLISGGDHSLVYFHEFKQSAHRVDTLYRKLVEEVGRQKHVTHEIESIFDNFFVVETAIFDIRNSMRKEDVRKLPLIKTAKSRSVPRLYYILSKLVEETNRIVDKDVINQFLITYQEYSPLSIRELYAIPGILQIVFVEHFGKLIEKAIDSLKEYEEAGKIVKRIKKEVSKKNQHNITKVISDLASDYSIVPLSLGFYLLQRLSPEGSVMRPILRWLKLNFEKQGINVKDLADLESKERGKNSVIASNIIESLHWLTQARWENIVEEINVVDAILSKDPVGAFPLMSMESKNHYRQIIVRIAETSSIHEAEVARTAVRLATQAHATTEKGRSKDKLSNIAEGHVGYYLIDEGRLLLESRIDYVPTFKEKLYRFITNHPSGIYFGGAIGLDVLATAVFVAMLARTGAHPGVIGAAGALSLFLNLEIALSLINVLISRFLPVRKLASLDLSAGISEKQRTFVVIPTMLRSPESIREIMRKLEIRYLGNKGDNILYAVLFGFRDADKEVMPGDEALIEVAKQEIEALNKKYSSEHKKFHIFYRKRRWNDKEGKFMEWERKRGKLREFNMLLRGVRGTSFINESDMDSIPHVKYVITLDEDTELPKDAARKLIGSIDHPLNTPIFSKEGHMLERGYGIIQPRAGVRLATAAKSLYSRLYSIGSGIDSYSNAISDVYQDLFGNALFFGKGIYDVDAIEKTMEGQIPDNTVLSHDLLEGVYARTGYASDVVLFDGFPNYYHEFATRLHRWIRGDWQIIGWLKKKRWHISGVERTFTLVDRFKIFDNLRRSLVPVFSLALVAFVFFNQKVALTVAIYTVIVLASPSFFAFCNDLFSLKKIPLRIRAVDICKQFGYALIHTLLRIIFLVHHAAVSFSAISITVWRLFVSRRNLLEWQNFADAGRKFKGNLSEFYRTMYVTQIVALAYVAHALYTKHIFLDSYLFAVAWLSSPLVGYIVSRPIEKIHEVSKNDERLLRSVAYKTARYFLDLSRRENNWLIQDHYQEFPKLSQVDRLTTSPTNLGMLFTSLFSSYELGYVSLDQFLQRSRKAFTSLLKLERYRGHLYNWYDIEKLEPLSPAYLSSVDSANFIVALITFRQGLRGLSKRPVVGAHSIRGLEDGLYSIRAEAYSLKKIIKSRTERHLVKDLYEVTNKTYEKVRTAKEPKTFSDFYKLFADIHGDIVHIEKAVASLRADHAIVGADQLFFFVEHLAKLVEEELGFQRYLLPHLHSRDHTIDTHVSRDENLSVVYKNLIDLLETVPSLHDVGYELLEKVRAFDFRKAAVESNLIPQTKEYVIAWYDELVKDMLRSQLRAKEFLSDLEIIERDANRFIDEPEFGFLYNKERGLFHIGYNGTYERVDSACYNFLASESNLVSFVAILKNQVPQKHWFYLGRKLVRSGGHVALVSWGGSLFEYLTSLIYLKAHEESLLGSTARAAIAVHRKHGFRQRIPWGMGESAYYLFDAAKHYQYQVFGSPALGLKRGLADYEVLAPYVSALSLSFVPEAAAKNLQRMAALGGTGNFGFYDALDYMDEARMPLIKPLPARVYYAHHQGFTLLGIHNFLDKDRIRNLFHSDPSVASLEILLEEKMPATPAATTLSLPTRLPFTASAGVSDDGSESKQYIPVKTQYPQFALIGNGTYSAMISNAGAGKSRYKKVSLTRYKDDSMLEESGSFIYIRNEKTKTLWSPTLRPLGGDTKRHKVVYHENKAEFNTLSGTIASKLEIAVAATEPVEVRELTLTNTGETTERLSVASYGEVSLALESEESHHPQYQKLLVRSVFSEEFNALIYSRPYPGDRTRKIYFAHMLAREGFGKDKVHACVDREFFIGRSRNIKDPLYFDRVEDAPLKEFTLDPIFSLSKSIELKPKETARFVYVNIAHEDYEGLLDLIRKYKRSGVGANVVSAAIKNSADKTRDLGITQNMAVLFQDLASRALGGRRFETTELPQSPLPYIHSLWKLGISGDYPVVVVKIKDIEDIQTIKHALLCHAYWKHKGLEIDLVILNQEPASYIKVLDDEIDFLLRQSKGVKSDVAGSTVHHVKSDLTEEIDKKVLLHVARVTLDSKDGTFKQQIKAFSKLAKAPQYPAKHVPTARAVHHIAKSNPLPGNLEFKNAWGGYDVEKSEYVMNVSSHNLPFAPWSNIITSPHFGTVVTESGSMFTWSKDSYDNRITSWNNDPLVFKSSEIVYVRDEATGEVWNPTPMPIRTKYPYTVRHGKGYTIFEHARGPLSCSLEITVPLKESVKVLTLRMKNNGAKARTLSETIYLEPAMNMFRDHARDFITYERNEKTGALMFKQSFRNQLPNSTAFADVSSGDFTITTDKAEFLGRHGSFEHPAALKREGLSNEIMSGTTNCAVLQTKFTVEPGEEKQIVFFLGEAQSKVEAEMLVESLRKTFNLKDTKKFVSDFWKQATSQVTIDSPDKSLNALFNSQLLYQALSSRIWGKTGFYQPSGAFGLRDQLQDMSAFIWSKPQDVREFILKAAAHQFKEGDALNWWHDHNSFGARSVLSDHQLWLVYVTLEYIAITGDESILGVEIPFLEGPTLNFAYQREWAGTPKVSEEKGTLYEHCVRALAKSSVLGEHELPLIGQSDWNDGLSRAGVLGRGESVWVGWFLGSLTQRFSAVARKRGDIDKAEYYASYSQALAKAIEKHAWDGRWYRRVFLDSGTVLGSRKQNEFKIDSIAQSWAVLSGLAPKERVEKAMDSTFAELFDGSNMKLLTPALRNAPFDPGYVKDYPPGVRENGSQYNHAALWAVQAFFKTGNSDNAMKVLDLINPFKRTDSAEKAKEYRVEPYVVASDVYAEPSYKGRGGWTWYTGSAGVMYRTILEYLFGVRVEDDALIITPSFPTDWKTATLTYNRGGTIYKITYEKPAGVLCEVSEISENGVVMPDKKIPLSKDGKVHEIRVMLTPKGK